MIHRIILGASDPEMAAIADLARAAGLEVIQATDSAGRSTAIRREASRHTYHGRC